MDSERTGVRVGVRGGHGRPRLAAQLGSELLGTRLVAHMGLCLICLLAVSIDVYAQISAPTSCEITQSSFSVSNVQKKTYSVSSSEERLHYDLQVALQGTCSSNTGETQWVSSSSTRTVQVYGDSWTHRTGDVYHRIKLKETGESGGLTVTDADEAMRCYSEEFKGTWTKGSELTCDSTTGSISGDCRDLYNAVEVSVCYEVQNPKMCIDPKQVSGTLNIYAKFHLKAEGTSVQSSPTVAVDMSQYYDCSGGDEVSILSSMAAGAARVGGSLVLMLLYFVGSG